MNSIRGGGGGEYHTDVSHNTITELLDLVGLGGERGIEGIGEVELSNIIQGFVRHAQRFDRPQKARPWCDSTREWF